MNKICFHVERNIKEWYRIKSIDKPIYPIPGSLMNELSQKNTFSFFSRSIIKKYKINKYKIYNNFNEMLNNNDIYITTGGNYINFLFSNYSLKISKLISKKAIPILYKVPTSKTDLNFYKYQLIYKFSKAQIYTSISQFEYAKKHKIGSPIFLPIGIDTQFYKSQKSSNLKNWLLNKKYIVMHGDEDRNHIELIKIADFLKIGIIRISQYSEKDKHKNSIFNIASKSKNIKFVYHFQNVNFDDYITILKNAYLYCGAVKSNISPNGWTAICEAKALNIPIIAKKGFVTEDFKKVFGKDDNRNFIEISNFENDKNKILNFCNSLENLKFKKKYSEMTDYINTSKIFNSQLIKNGIISN